MENIRHIVATGRCAAHFEGLNRVVENALCIARGLFYLSRSVRTVIDLGDQSIRIFRFAPKGKHRELSVSNYKEFLLSDRGYSMDISTAISGHLDRVGSESACALVGGGTEEADLVKVFQGLLPEDLFISPMTRGPSQPSAPPLSRKTP